MQSETDRLLLSHLRAIYSRSTSGDVNIILQQWMYLVEQYTKRTLSVPRDRLSAISALAQFFAKNVDCPYAAGIWLKDLTQLIWTHASTPCQPRPRPCLAPSWSWASICSSSRIQFTHRDEYSQKFMSVDPELRLITHELTPSAPFAASIAGSLEVEGLVRQAVWA
jgi:hypothetical protein